MKYWSHSVRSLLVRSLLAGSLAAAGVHPPASAAGETGLLLISGSSAMAPLVEALARQYEQDHPGVRIAVRTGGSARALADAREGKSDIGMVSRPLQEKDSDLQDVPFARDGVAIVVHNDNPVTALSDAQVKAIFTGRLSNWKQLGGRDLPITVIGVEPDRAAHELFDQYFGVASADEKVQRRLGETGARIAAVAADPASIHYLSVGAAERAVRSGVPIRLLPAGGVSASSANIRSGDFPIARPLSLVTRGRAQGLAKAFIDYCLSAQATALIVQHDFVPYLD